MASIKTATDKQIAFYAKLHTEYVPLMKATVAYLNAGDATQASLDTFLADMPIYFAKMSISDASNSISLTLAHIKDLKAAQSKALEEAFREDKSEYPHVPDSSEY